MKREPLPIDTHIATIRDALRAHRAVVVTAAPGAGKTTRVPPALVDDGPVILLQPRRVAARAIARRIADEQGWTLGTRSRLAHPLRAPVRAAHPVAGRHRRHPDRAPAAGSRCCRTSARSCSTSSTSAAFTRDLGLALARQAWRARDDLRIVVMSATLDAGRVRPSSATARSSRCRAGRTR